MKKFLLTILTLSILSSSAFAGISGLFTYDAEKFNQEMSQLQALEDFVAVNPGHTLNNLQAEDFAMISDLNMITCNYGGIGVLSGEDALGIPSFIWGCCFGLMGVILVHIVTEDKEETKKALYGYLASIAGTGVIYVVYVVLILTLSGAGYFYY